MSWLFRSAGIALVGVAIGAGQAIAEAVSNKKEQRDGASAKAPEIHVDVRSRSSRNAVEALTCPNCNASVQPPAGRDSCYCSYCGTLLSVDDDSVTVTYRTVDDNRLREAEIEYELEMRRIELEEKRRPGRIKATIVLAVIGVVLLFVGIMVNNYLILFSLLVFTAILLIWAAAMNDRSKPRSS